MPYNDILTIENDSIVIGGEKQTAVTNKLFECNIPAKFTNKVVAPHSILNYEFHPIELADGITASSLWSGANEPGGGLYYILENKNHVILCGDVSFTPSTSTSATDILSKPLPEEIQPKRILSAICAGNCDTGYVINNNRILKILVFEDGVIACGGSIIPGGGLSGTKITKCSIYVEYWLN